MEVAKHCPNLQHLNVSYTHGSITDTSIIEVAKHCPNLQWLNVSNTSGNITDNGTPAVVGMGPDFSIGSVTMAYAFLPFPFLGSGWEILIPLGEIPASPTDSISLGVLFYDIGQFPLLPIFWADLTAPGALPAGAVGISVNFGALPANAGGPYSTTPRLLPVELSSYSLE